MSLRQFVCVALVGMCLGVARPGEAASRHEELATVGGIVFGASYGLPVLASTAAMIGADNMKRSDFAFYGTLLLPCVGPAIIGVQIIEEHPVTWLVGGFLFVVSMLQTAGMVMLVSGLVGMAGGRGWRRCSRRAGIWPTMGPTPAGVGLVGVF